MRQPIVAEYEVVPVTVIVTADGRMVESPCTDEQAMEWYIYATDVGTGERKLILHAVSRAIADAVVNLFERRS